MISMQWIPNALCEAIDSLLKFRWFESVRLNILDFVSQKFSAPLF